MQVIIESSSQIVAYHILELIFKSFADLLPSTLDIL